MNSTKTPPVTSALIDYLKKVYPLSDALEIEEERVLYIFQGVQGVVSHLEAIHEQQKASTINVHST